MRAVIWTTTWTTTMMTVLLLCFGTMLVCAGAVLVRLVVAPVRAALRYRQLFFSFLFKHIYFLE